MNKNFSKEKLFVEPKLHNLEFIWRFQLSQPWFVPDEEIRNYFGEKIALYFKFLGYYTKQHLWIGVLGLVTFTYQTFYEQHSVHYIISAIIFGIIQIQWTSSMSELWR